MNLVDTIKESPEASALATAAVNLAGFLAWCAWMHFSRRFVFLRRVDGFARTLIDAATARAEREYVAPTKGVNPNRKLWPGERIKARNVAVALAEEEAGELGVSLLRSLGRERVEEMIDESVKKLALEAKPLPPPNPGA